MYFSEQNIARYLSEHNVASEIVRAQLYFSEHNGASEMTRAQLCFSEHDVASEGTAVLF